MVYSEVDVYRICKSVFEMLIYYGMCLNVVFNFNNEILVNCMNDFVVSLVLLVICVNFLFLYWIIDL